MTQYGGQEFLLEEAVEILRQIHDFDKEMLKELHHIRRLLEHQYPKTSNIVTCPDT